MTKAYIADFGAGNTSLYSVVINAEIPSASALNNPNGEPSGYAVDVRENYRIGTGIYGLDYSDLSALTQFRINIKAIPNDQNEAEMIEYFGAWLQKIKTEHPAEFSGVDEQYWLIGCPTGKEWKEEATRMRYQQIFEKAGFENVRIIPESNAALAFYQKTANAMDGIDPEIGTLLIDQGAYSLDATHFGNGEITSLGSYLGAGIVEKLMLHVILNVPEEKYRKNHKPHNLPETLASARRLYAENGERGNRFRTYLLLKARMLKEDYFVKLRNGTLGNTRDLTITVDLDEKDDPLILFTNRQMMEDILYHKPIREILGEDDYASMLHPEVREELEGNDGNPSWMQAFENFLLRVDQQYGAFAKAAKVKGEKKPKILVTGGGSMMGCVGQALRNHYPEAVVYVDPNPIEVIAKGMAFWAPDKIRAEKFANEFEALLKTEERDEDGDMRPFILTMFGKTLHDCLQEIVDMVIEEETKAVFSAVEGWSKYKYDGDRIPFAIETHVTNWAQGEGIENAKAVITREVNKLKTKINERFAHLLNKYEKYGMGSDVLLSEDDKVFLSESQTLLEGIFEVIAEIISEHYKKTSAMWAQFPNPKKGLFLLERKILARGSFNALKDFLDKATDSTLEVFKSLCFVHEYEYGEDQYTFAELFVREGYYDMLTLAEKRKKKLLGKLVLEEYLENT